MWAVHLEKKNWRVFSMKRPSGKIFYVGTSNLPDRLLFPIDSNNEGKEILHDGLTYLEAARLQQKYVMEIGTEEDGGSLINAPLGDGKEEHPDISDLIKEERIVQKEVRRMTNGKIRRRRRTKKEMEEFRAAHPELDTREKIIKYMQQLNGTVNA